MTNQQRADAIRERVTAALTPSQCEIIDQSHKHIGHPGAKSGAGHFKIIIAADAFNNKPLIDCHKLVYQAVGDLIPTEVHALSITIQQ